MKKALKIRMDAGQTPLVDKATAILKQTLEARSGVSIESVSAGRTVSLGLRAGWPLIRTTPAITARFAFSRLSHKPRSTST